MVLGPGVDFLDRGEDGGDRRRIGGDEFLLAEIELPIGGDAVLAIGEGARFERQFGGGLERLPDRPGVDRAMFERRARVGRAQEKCFDVAIGEAGLLQRPDQEVMDIRAFVQRDALALEFGDAVQRAVLGTRIASARGAGGSLAT